ncbi:ankyrin repeat domain-containing protein [Thalassotalea euphylliae]|uniref:ankyrin repeat domain-containing protein n=1 Tax=Thalassotalea euphylliae TaxID=1655234 RepID=UPI003640010E
MKIIYLVIFLATSFDCFADVVVDLSRIKEGEYQFVNWQNLPVLVYHRTREQIELLNTSTDKAVNLASNDFYARRYGNTVANGLLRGEQFNQYRLRSSYDKWFVAIGASPEIGVKLRIKSDKNAIMNPMDGSLYDLTGRVIGNSLNKKDLSIPSYTISDQSLIIFTKSLPDDIDFSEGKINSKDQPEKQIVDALSWKKFELVGEILDQNPSIIKNSEVNLAVLVAATTYGDKELLKKAINYGAEINIVFRNKSTPLNTALISNYLDMAKYLIESGAKTESFCQPTDCKFCSTPTLEIAKMMEDTEQLVMQWLKMRSM